MGKAVGNGGNIPVFHASPCLLKAFAFTECGLLLRCALSVDLDIWSFGHLSIWSDLSSFALPFSVSPAAGPCCPPSLLKISSHLTPSHSIPLSVLVKKSFKLATRELKML